jgi:hypothetical protein
MQRIETRWRDDDRPAGSVLNSVVGGAFATLLVVDVGGMLGLDQPADDWGSAQDVATGHRKSQFHRDLGSANSMSQAMPTTMPAPMQHPHVEEVPLRPLTSKLLVERRRVRVAQQGEKPMFMT